MSQATLANRVESYFVSAQRSVFNEIWPIGRQHLPQQPGAAENAMNQALAKGWCYEDGSEVVSCKATVYVHADARVVTKQLPLWEQLVEMDMRQRIEYRRLCIVEDLVGRWRDLIGRLGEGPVVVHASRLVDREFASSRTEIWRRH